MSGLLFLTQDDFFIAKGTKGNILCSSIPGFSLILFYSPQCEHCQNFIPLFKKICGTVGGCQFGMVNIGANKGIIRMSKETISPITFVPYILLAVGGKPLMVYRGPPDINEMRRFIIEVAQKINSKQKFSEEKVQEPPRGNIPQYTIGHPLFGEDEDFYFEFNKAYKDEKKLAQANGGNLFGQNDSRSNLQNQYQSTVQKNSRR
jgi:hypothetical protein